MKSKFYVVWQGKVPGIYTNWADCQAQVGGFGAARYKAFATRQEAEAAFAAGPEAYIAPRRPKAGDGVKTTSHSIRPTIATIRFFPSRRRWKPMRGP